MNLDALLYTEEAAKVAKVTNAVIRQWAKRYPDLMPVRHRDWRRRPQYWLGDVLAVELKTRASRGLTTR